MKKETSTHTMLLPGAVRLRRTAKVTQPDGGERELTGPSVTPGPQFTRGSGLNHVPAPTPPCKSPVQPNPRGLRAAPTEVAAQRPPAAQDAPVPDSPAGRPLQRPGPLGPSLRAPLNLPSLAP